MIYPFLVVLTMKSMVLASAGSTPGGEISRWPMRKQQWGTGAEGTVSGIGITRRDSNADALQAQQNDSTDVMLGVDVEATGSRMSDIDNVDDVDVGFSTQVPLTSHSNTEHAVAAQELEELAVRQQVPLVPPTEPTTPLSKGTPVMPYKVLHHRSEHAHSLPEEGNRIARPPLYGVLAALAASLGYALLMVTRCKGFMNELTLKQPLAGFMHSHRATRENGQSRRNDKKATARFCPSRFNREVLQI